MTIRLHSFISLKKRFVQVETQPSHITGIYREIQQIIKLRGCDFIDIRSAYYECTEDGTATFYLAEHPEGENAGIWTYLVYKCPEGQEKIEPAPEANTSIKPLYDLLAGEKILQPTSSIEEYLAYMYGDSEYLDVELPYHWDTYEGRRIAEQLLKEYVALRKSIVFASGAGKKYAKLAIASFIELAVDTLEKGGCFWDFDTALFSKIAHIDCTLVSRQIMEFNDYLIWQDALPSKSKAVEYAFQNALNLITHIR